MDLRKNLVFLVAFLSLVFLASNASAFAQITSVEVAGIEAISGNVDISAHAGETVPVRVIFFGTANATDVEVEAELSHRDSITSESKTLIVDSGDTQSVLIPVKVPFDIDPRETMFLEITVRSDNQGVGDRETITLTAKREPYLVEILDIAMDTTVSAGSNLAAEVVLKNRGREFAEDTFVRVTIPALSVEQRVYFGDISPEDEPFSDGVFDTDRIDRLRNQDAVQRRVNVAVPQSTPAGIYTVQFEAFTSDSSTTVTRKISVVGASGDSRVVSPLTSKTFDVRDDAVYSVTVVNSGSNTRVYELSFESPSGITLQASESIFAIPAGESKTVNVVANAEKAGKYNFVVNVNSEGELVKKESLEARVNGASGSANATVVLTVILAIIFIVLLVVLIVLLTRKPQAKEEFGESYY